MSMLTFSDVKVIIITTHGSMLKTSSNKCRNLVATRFLLLLTHEKIDRSEEPSPILSQAVELLGINRVSSSSK
jgi:hypothetical protein